MLFFLDYTEYLNILHIFMQVDQYIMNLCTKF